MKILFITNYYSPIIGGAELSLQIQAKTLCQDGHDIMVLALDIPGVASHEELEGVKVERLPLRNIYEPQRGGPQPKYKKILWHMIDAYNLAMARAVKEAVTRLKPEVVNTQNIGGFSVAIWSAVKSWGMPLVHTIRDQYLLCPRGTMFHKGQTYEKQCLAAKLYCWLKRYPCWPKMRF